MTMLRRLFLILAVLVATPAVALAGPLPAVTSSDRILGRADAPVTVVEYASFVCSHCAAWHKDVMPEFKTRYIDTGRVRLVFRNLPTNPQNFASTAAALGKCAAPDHFFAVADSFFEGQAALFAGGTTWFSDAISISGRTRPEIETCFADPATQSTLDAEIAGARDAGVEGTPTFFVNGRKVEDTTLAGLGAAIDAARSGI